MGAESGAAGSLDEEDRKMAARMTAILTEKIADSCARALEAGLNGSAANVVEVCEMMICSGPAPRHEAGYRLVKADVLCEAGMYGPALEEADRAAELEPDLASWGTRGDVLQAKGDHAAAVESYERAEKRARGRDLAGVIARKLKSLEILRRREECVAEAGRALEADPGNPTALAYRVGNMRATGRGKEALELAGRTLAEGENPVVGIHMAAMLYEEGRDKEALAAVNGVTKYLGRSHDLWLLKARLLARLGRREEAIDAVTVAAGLDRKAASEAARGDDLSPLRGEAQFDRLFGGKA